jgi:hypothetical protein
MSIQINDDIMTLELDGKVIAEAKRRPGGWWEVTNWPRFFDRNQAITALAVWGSIIGPGLVRLAVWDHR